MIPVISPGVGGPPEWYNDASSSGVTSPGVPYKEASIDPTPAAGLAEGTRPALTACGTKGAIGPNGSKGAAPASAAQPAGLEKKDWVNPFADLDDSRVQVPSAGRKMKDISPPGLMETELFVRAKQLAEDGQELAKEAFAARDSGDKERFRELGLQAREKLFEATALTADWWIELNEKYPDDRQIEKISRVRSRWDRSFNQLRVIR